MNRRVGFCVAAAVAIVGLIAGYCPALTASERMSDKDVQRMMMNLRNDAKRFQESFNRSIGKSTIRKTQQENDAKILVKNFVNQTNTMLTQFKNNRQADATLTNARESASRIDKLMTDVTLGPTTGDAWTKVKMELSTISDAFRAGS
jgi:hypothetical protein